MKLNKEQLIMVAMMLSASVNEVVNKAEIANAYEIAMKDMKGEL